MSLGDQQITKQFGIIVLLCLWRVTTVIIKIPFSLTQPIDPCPKPETHTIISKKKKKKKKFSYRNPIKSQTQTQTQPTKNLASKNHTL